MVLILHFDLFFVWIYLHTEFIERRSWRALDSRLLAMVESKIYYSIVEKKVLTPNDLPALIASVLDRESRSGA